VEGGTEFEHLAAEHREGLNHQQNNIKEVMASDVEPLEEIETWRQMVGLEELQAAAGKMSEQLATIEEEKRWQSRTRKRDRNAAGQDPAGWSRRRSGRRRNISVRRCRFGFKRCAKTRRSDSGC